MPAPKAETRKLAYYRGGTMQPPMARRYYSAFGGAAKILDVGCGLGAFGRYAPPGAVVHGVDADAGAVEAASRHEHALCVDLDKDGLPYPDDHFDAVLAKDILEHLQHPWTVVGEIFRVLRPGGVVVASVVVARPTRVWADYTHVRGFTRSAAMLLFEDAGLRVDAVWLVGPVPLSRRLGFLHLVPWLLRVPVLSHLWAASWELKGIKAA